MNKMNKKITSGYPLIINYLGIFAFLIGFINLLPLILLAFRPEEIEFAHYFLIPGLTSIFVGSFIIFIFRKREKGKLERHQDAVLVMSIWLMAILISSVPFMLTGTYNFTQSIFESTSGYSTTGLSVVNVEQTPGMFLLFRSLLQFFGGVGLVLVLTSAISDKFGMRLYSAEGHSDKLMPNLIRSGRTIISIYVGYIALGTLFYVLFGMPVFDAINHSICALSTGGFSTQSGSIGSYNNLPIEIITMVLMILGATNFFVHLMLIRGKLKNVFKHVENKLLVIILLIFIPLMTINILSYYDGQFFYSLRVTSFQLISAITSTGYQSVPSFLPLPTFFMFGIIVSMAIGGSMGSTAGGMKQYRVALAFKSLYWNIKDQLGHKKTIRTHFINKLGTRTIVDKDDIIQNHSFLTIYFLVLILGAVIISTFGYSIKDSLFEFASALGTVGLSIGITGYTANPIVLWTLSIGMFLGRLEFYVIFVAIAKISLDLKKRKPRVIKKLEA
ncbi:MAG: TrkH family potassium uptake protein [Acholeplasmataceae bacterium]|nr:TrkH family potassium uptake protein [Acholeplasmataceae bacterium]